MKLTSKIVKDMIASEQYRISLSVTTTTDKLNDKVNESFKFFFSQYESYISLINDYLQYKKIAFPQYMEFILVKKYVARTLLEED